MANTGIPYATKALNHLVGCPDPCVSRGCEKCWARALHQMRHRAALAGKKMPAQYSKPFTELQFLPGRLAEPLRWEKPQRVFVTPQSDLFHAAVPDKTIAATFGVMAATPRNLYLVLTKRPERMLEWTSRVQDEWEGCRRVRSYNPKSTVADICTAAAVPHINAFAKLYAGSSAPWPLPNVLLGATVCDQAEADRVVPVMARLAAQGWRTWLSVEPMLGPVNLGLLGTCPESWGLGYRRVGEGLEWVVAGCESPVTEDRMAPDPWFQALLEECRAAGTLFYMKQRSTFRPDSANKGHWVASARLCGFPEELRVRELPAMPEVSNA